MMASKIIDVVLQRTMIIVTIVLVVYTSAYSLPLQPGKDPMCHYLNMDIPECKVSLYPIKNYSLNAWFYHSPFKSCRPVFSEGGITHCKENLDLPLTKDECEAVCGESCPISTGQPGICMMSEYCPNFTDPDLSMAFRIHCKAYNVKCCPPRKGPLVSIPRTRQKTVPPSKATSPKPLQCN